MAKNMNLSAAKKNVELIACGLQHAESVKSLFGSVVPGRFLIPGQLCGITGESEIVAENCMRVYYISDLHLESWYEEYCKTAKALMSMSEWIEMAIDSLFSGNFLQDIVDGHSVTVLFLGDMTESFVGAELFYKAFMHKWDAVDEENRQLFERQEAERLAEEAAQYEADVHCVEEYQALHPWAKRSTYSLVLNANVPDDIKSAVRRIERWELCEKSGVSRSRDFQSSYRDVYAILGNHEINEFVGGCKPEDVKCLGAAYEKGKETYRELFHSLDICFLDEGEIFVGGHLNQCLIAGFCGFSDPQCGFDVLGNYEVMCRDELVAHYKKCVEFAKCKNQVLIFCTHFPLQLGVTRTVCKNNVYYFCGHTHHNECNILSETSAIIADNQIGYGWKKGHKKLVFGYIDLYPWYNPFDLYEDGCYAIKIEEYQRFYWYCGERVKTGTVERYLRGIGPFNKLIGDIGRLYMIKKHNYYGFFIVFEEIKRVYICNGGMVKPVSNVNDIGEVLLKFEGMVNACLQIFSGLRQYQEQIALYIRSFGGEGKIHGLIVDIDFYNHVGVDPVSGEVMFYYSPWFGAVQSYSDMEALLENHAPALYSAYKQLSSTSLVPCYSQDAVVENKLVGVERGGKSFYGASRYMSSVQRLFACNILRVWDEAVMDKAKAITHSLEKDPVNMSELNQYSKDKR